VSVMKDFMELTVKIKYVLKNVKMIVYVLIIIATVKTGFQEFFVK
jgi:hypothetical protein